MEIINSLLSHLRISVTKNQPTSNDEQLYQEALINALGEFANHLPDYQKIEIMMFIMSKVPYSQPDRIVSVGKGDVLLQSILLKSLLKVIYVLFTLSMQLRHTYIICRAHYRSHLSLSLGWHKISNDTFKYNISTKFPGAIVENVAGG